jgi:hypothetical protein
MKPILSLVVVVSSLCAGACAVDQPGDVSGEGGGSGSDNSGGGGGDGTGCIEGPCMDNPPPDQGGADDPSNPIDTACAGDQNVDAPQLLVPKWTPLAPTVPDDCLVGFEMNRLEQHVHTLQSAAGSRAITLEVDIATYTASDAIRISAVDGNGNATILIDTCRMRTAEYGDPTGGTTRPPEDSIRDFRTNLPAGTKQLVIDNTNASTPTYVRVLGLCDFSMQAPPTTDLKAGWFRPVSSR